MKCKKCKEPIEGGLLCRDCEKAAKEMFKSAIKKANTKGTEKNDENKKG